MAEGCNHPLTRPGPLLRAGKFRPCATEVCVACGDFRAAVGELRGVWRSAEELIGREAEART